MKHGLDKMLQEEEYYLICPECEHYPLTLSGEIKGLDYKITDGKVQCPICAYERILGEEV